MMGAERLLVQQAELGQELQEPCLRAHDVQQEGRQLIDSGHFMSLEVGAQKGWSPTAQGLGTPSRNLSPQEKAGKEQRERGQEGKGRVWAFPGALCWPLQASSASVLPLEHLTQSIPSHQVAACLRELEGQLQALTEACTLRQERCEENWGLQKLRQELDGAEAWLASREVLLLDPNYGVSPVSPTPLASYTDWQLWPRAGPAVPQLPTR